MNLQHKPDSGKPLSSVQVPPCSLTWKYFGPLHQAHHLLPGQAVETGQQVVGGVRLRVVEPRIHLLRLDQLQHAADGGWQKRCDHPGSVGHQGVGSAGVQLLLRGQVVASGPTCGRLPVLAALQVLVHPLQLPQLLGLPCCGTQTRSSG